jgi:hypothetical protein
MVTHGLQARQYGGSAAQEQIDASMAMLHQQWLRQMQRQNEQLRVEPVGPQMMRNPIPGEFFFGTTRVLCKLG